MSSPRRFARVVVAVGSNIDAERNLPRALARLGAVGTVLALSRVWETEPVGSPGSPPFLNAAVLLHSRLAPAELRRRLRAIETELGRRRSRDPNAPRPIDLDIVLVDDRVLDDPECGLRLPDPALCRRPHVGYPAGEAAPDLRHPTDGRPLSAIAAELGPPGRVRSLPGWSERRAAPAVS